MHPKLLLDADVVYVHNNTVTKMDAKQVETVGLHAGRGLVVCGTHVRINKQSLG